MTTDRTLHQGEYRCSTDGDETIVVTGDSLCPPHFVQRAAENAAEYFEAGGDYIDDKVIEVETWKGERYRVAVRSETLRRHYASGWVRMLPEGEGKP